MQTYIPMDPNKMPRAERFKALSALVLLVKKRDDVMKARKCAVRSKQCIWEGYKIKDGAYHISNTPRQLTGLKVSWSMLVLEITGVYNSMYHI